MQKSVLPAVIFGGHVQDVGFYFMPPLVLDGWWSPTLNEPPKLAGGGLDGILVGKQYVDERLYSGPTKFVISPTFIITRDIPVTLLCHGIKRTLLFYNNVLSTQYKHAHISQDILATLLYRY